MDLIVLMIVLVWKVFKSVLCVILNEKNDEGVSCVGRTNLGGLEFKNDLVVLMLGE